MKVAFDATKWFSGGYPAGSKLAFRHRTCEGLEVLHNPTGAYEKKLIVNYKYTDSKAVVTSFRYADGVTTKGVNSEYDLMVELPDPLQGKAWAQVNVVSNVARFLQFPPDMLAGDAIEAGWRNIRIKWEEIPE